MKCCRFPLAEILNKVLASEGEELKMPLNNNLFIIESFKIDKKNSQILDSLFSKKLLFNQITIPFAVIMLKIGILF